jgi:hypothetical protein
MQTNPIHQARGHLDALSDISTSYARLCKDRTLKPLFSTISTALRAISSDAREINGPHASVLGNPTLHGAFLNAHVYGPLLTAEGASFIQNDAANANRCANLRAAIQDHDLERSMLAAKGMVQIAISRPASNG